MYPAKIIARLTFSLFPQSAELRQSVGLVVCELRIEAVENSVVDSQDDLESWWLVDKWLLLL